MEVLLWGRIVERIMISFFAGCSLFLGWHLFIVGVLKDQSAEIEHGNLKIRLRKVAPGIFFALFGATILICALSSPMTIDEEIEKYLKQQNPSDTGFDKTGERKPPSGRPLAKDGTETKGRLVVRYADGGFIEESNLKNMVIALNTPIILITQTSVESGLLGKSEHLRILRANEALKAIRRDLLRQKFSDNQLSYWHNSENRFLKEPEAFPKEEQALLNKMKPWMTETIK